MTNHHPKVRMEVLSRGGVAEIEFRYKGKKKFYRGSSLGTAPTLRDPFVRQLADEFATSVDTKDHPKRGQQKR